MPNIRIQNTSPSLRNQNATPNVRVSPGSVGVTTPGVVTTFAGKGYLIGMMALTYIKQYSVTGPSTTVGGNGPGPSIRIANI